MDLASSESTVASLVAQTGRFVSEDRGVIVEAAGAPAPCLRPEGTTVAVWGFCGVCTTIWDQAFLRGLRDMAAVNDFLWVHKHRPLTQMERDVVRRELTLRHIDPAAFDVWTRGPADGGHEKTAPIRAGGDTPPGGRR